MNFEALKAEAEELEASLLVKYAGVPLVRYFSYRGMSHAGHCIQLDGNRIGGVSAGALELKMLFDVVVLTDARYSVQIGVAFGFSTIAMAIASSKNLVVGIDNFSEKEGTHPGYVRELARRVLGGFRNILLLEATSPLDTKCCLDPILEGKKLSLVLIDACHTDKAALDDFVGLLPYIDSHSIVFWHDIDKIPRAFIESFKHEYFDTALQLKTWGNMGVHLNKKIHPHVVLYLERFYI